MGFRTVVINSKSKLELSLDYLVCRNDTETRIHISEISLLIIQSTAVSLTAAVLCELIKNNIRIILCDEKYQPYGEVMPYYTGYKNSLMIKQQINWDASIADLVWAELMRHKIANQMNVLASQGFSEEADMLKQYIQEIQPGDVSNREGHAAKVYFNRAFGEGFTREQDNFTNKCLNYGYSVILSSFNRQVNMLGYLTQLGIHHCNEYNPYNLACDLMEPFRSCVDELTLTLKEDDPDFKHKLADVLNKKIKINDMNTTVDNAINVYTSSVLNSLNGTALDIKFPSGYEL